MSKLVWHSNFDKPISEHLVATFVETEETLANEIQRWLTTRYIAPRGEDYYMLLPDDDPLLIYDHEGNPVEPIREGWRKTG